MFDTMTLTKAGGALCGALLIYLLGVWFAEEIFHAGGHDVHGDAHETAFKIDTGDEGPTEVVDEGPDFMAVFAEADVEKGAKAFSKCKACHKLGEGEAGGTGPNLFGVVGREIASLDGYTYSSALKEAGGTWTPEELNKWLENPGGYAKGTKMTFKTRKITDRANLIAYFQTIGN